MLVELGQSDPNEKSLANLSSSFTLAEYGLCVHVRICVCARVLPIRVSNHPALHRSHCVELDCDTMSYHIKKYEFLSAANQYILRDFFSFFF